MKSLDEVRTFYKNATIDTNPAGDDVVRNDALHAGKLKPKKRAAQTEPRIWRWIMKSNTTKLATAALVVLTTALGISLLNRSTQPVYGMTEALELIAEARTMHIQGWRLDQRNSSGQPLKLPFEQWYDFENGCYRWESTNNRDDEIVNSLTVCDGEYVMRESAYKPVGEAWHDVVNFERVDPNAKRDGTMLDHYRQLRQVEGFTKAGEEIIDAERYEIWQGEFDSGVADFVKRVRFEVWLSPATGKVGRTRWWTKQEDQWVTTYERTLIERDVPLPEGLFVTEPTPGVEIKTSKAEATIPDRVSFLEEDLYADTQFRYASLNYRVRMVFALNDGSLLACWQAVDGLESHDQSKYFVDLRTGGDLPKLPVEVFALSPAPNVRDVLFVGFHLAHTEAETEQGRRWYEWSLYVPDREPPQPEAVMNYHIHYRLNVDRTESIEIRYRQTSTPDPQKIETQADFEAKVLEAMAARSDDGWFPEHVTYESVLRIAERLRASIAK